MHELFLDPGTGAPTERACTWMALHSLIWQWGDLDNQMRSTVFIRYEGPEDDLEAWLPIYRTETIGAIAMQIETYWL